MPELPEVETVKIGLEKLLPGQHIKKATHDNHKSFPNAQVDVEAFMLGAKITTVRRRAKVLIIDLDTDYSLLIHLKMTGQLVYRSHNNNGNFGAGHPSASLVGSLPDRSTRVVISLSEGTLYFNDQRKFGWMRLLPTIEIPELDFFKTVGPEPLAADFSAEDFIERLYKRKNSGIKAVLLDQKVVAGVGNIYADESLWGARVHPVMLVKDVPKERLKILFNELQHVLQLAIEKGGSTDRNYVNAEGKKGSYMDFARVFRREKLPCPRCGTTIEKTRVAGRGTHICPSCQAAAAKL
jgi:formamidopyrimidine-DNA glycosylase